MDLITSRTNPKIKQIRALRQVKERRLSGLFLVEGIRHVGEAVEASQASMGITVESIVFAPEQLDSSFARNLVEIERLRGTPCLPVSEQVLESLTDKENPQGILAAVRTTRKNLLDLNPANFSWGVALVAPQDPGNVGTILRTIDAVGASGLVLLDGGVDPYHPNSVRASMGAMFWYPLISASFSEFTHWVREHGYHVYGTSAHAEVEYRTGVQYKRPMILLLGSERQGLSPEQAAICEVMLHLPMKGRTTSLNLAVAAGVMLYQMSV